MQEKIFTFIKKYGMIYVKVKITKVPDRLKEYFGYH